VIVPWREWSIRSRQDALDYARSHNVPVTATEKSIYSRDRNLWQSATRAGALEDPANAAPDEVWMITRSPKEAPNSGRGDNWFEQAPVCVNGQTMPGAAIVETLNQIGGEHGVGRVDLWRTASSA
jgi:argininosuccinate synthase